MDHKIFVILRVEITSSISLDVTVEDKSCWLSVGVSRKVVI